MFSAFRISVQYKAPPKPTCISATVAKRSASTNQYFLFECVSLLPHLILQAVYYMRQLHIQRARCCLINKGGLIIFFNVYINVPMKKPYWQRR